MAAQRKIPVDLHFIASPRYKETAGVACGPVDVAGGRDAATLGLWRHWFSVSYKTQRGNAALFWLRFHAIIKKHSDYQRVIFQPVAASRRKSYNTFFTARGAISRTSGFVLSAGPRFLLARYRQSPRRWHTAVPLQVIDCLQADGQKILNLEEN